MEENRVIKIERGKLVKEDLFEFIVEARNNKSQVIILDEQRRKFEVGELPHYENVLEPGSSGFADFRKKENRVYMEIKTQQSVEHKEAVERLVESLRSGHKIIAKSLDIQYKDVYSEYPICSYHFNNKFDYIGIKFWRDEVEWFHDVLYNYPCYELIPDYKQTKELMDSINCHFANFDYPDLRMRMFPKARFDVALLKNKRLVCGLEVVKSNDVPKDSDKDRFLKKLSLEYGVQTLMLKAEAISKVSEEVSLADSIKSLVYGKYKDGKFIKIYQR